MKPNPALSRSKLLPATPALALLLSLGCAVAEPPTENAATHEADDDLIWNEADVVDLRLSGASILPVDAAEGRVGVEGAVVTISAAGTYRLSGTLDDGRVIVDASDDDRVQLILAGVDITCTTSAPIFVQNAGKVVVLLAEDTDNALTDSDRYLFEEDEDEPNAPLFSKDDLTIHGDGDGTGVLTVYAHFEDGIVGKDGLVISNARVVVSATADDGIRGKDYLVIRDSVIEVEAAGDALRSTNESDPALGYVRLVGGSYALIAGADGIQAVTDVVVDVDDLAIEAGGGAEPKSAKDVTAKGLKAGADVVIGRGTLFVDAAGHALHADRDLVITGGALVAFTGRDALHAEAGLQIEGGSVDVAQSEVGLEAAIIELTGGEVRVKASGDGLRVVDGEDASGAPIPAEGLRIDGSYVYLAADGDGVDANADIVMASGTLIIDGPAAALDYEGRFEMRGGLLVAVGSREMVQAPGVDSAQASLLMTYGASEGDTLEPGTIVCVQDEAGEALLTFAPRAAWSSVVYAAPGLVQGLVGTISTGGSATGEPLDGVYADATYRAGTQRAAFNISAAVNPVDLE